ncbi:MAG: sigma 54-interacting transcriptional regulator [Anaerovoracaceae bacterium]
MKRIAVVATEKEYALFLKNNIMEYLSRYAQFKAYSIPEIEKMDSLEEDFVLVSAFNIFQKVREKISKESEIIVLSLSLDKKQMESLNSIKEGTRALLVNFDNRTCMHTITSMYDAGFRHVELYPYFGEGEYDKSIKLAITPNETHLVPPEIKEVINVGESVVDMNSLYTIADKIGVSEEFAANEAIEARKKYYFFNSSMDRLLGEKESLTEKINTLIRLMNEGIIITDFVGRIYLTNDKALELMADRTKVLMGFNIEEVLPEIDVRRSGERLIKEKTVNLVASSVEIKVGDETAGYIISLVNFEEAEEKQHGMRSKLSETNNIARYTFDDIVGKSALIKKTIEDAKKIAKSDASVMIIGESGTGKEMFAQSIHNASSRFKYNFVAVNCAAIPDNLLESEMFGYEEGSFTGARKGGKIGYFELAHKGTIFLDEIGEMPLQLQSKLLRVLEEKKVMRVGSNRNIDVDVRIIAATNKDLYDMVQRGTFREDLYYRLNVLPLEIPELRARKGDILIVFDYFMEKMKNKITLTEEAKKTLENHLWRGNVRELRNVVEFIASKDDAIIDVEDLPPLKGQIAIEVRINSEEKTLIERFILNEGKDIDLYRLVLGKLKIGYANGERYGRKSILQKILDDGYPYTEAEVRRALIRLSEYGFVKVGKGRGGSMVTQEGIKLAELLETNKIGLLG